MKKAFLAFLTLLPILMFTACASGPHDDRTPAATKENPSADPTYFGWHRLGHSTPY